MEKKLYKNDLLSVLIQPCIFDKSMALLSFDDSPGSFLNISLHWFGASVSKLLTKNLEERSNFSGVCIRLMKCHNRDGDFEVYYSSL